MTKKIVSLLLALIMLAALSGCQKEAAPVTGTWRSGTEAPTEELTGNPGDFYLDEDDLIVYKYTENGWMMVSALEEAKDESKMKDETHWAGKTWYAYGTSLTATSSGRYANYVAQFSGMKLVNKGIGGGGICKDTRIRDAVMTLDDGKAEADLITLEVGANDRSGPLGSVYDTSSSTFCGALTQCIRYLQQNTNARIVVISSTTGNGLAPHKQLSGGYTNLEMWEATERVCKLNGCMYIPMGEGSGLGWQVAKKSEYVRDNIHHTMLGGYLLADFVWSELKDIPLMHTEIPS